MEKLELIKEALLENGINVTNIDDELEMDSIQFISVIVCIEDKFSIEIPETMLLAENFNTASDYLNIVESIITNKELFEY